MNRRNAIRTAMLFSAGAVLLPSCLKKDKSALSLKNISVTETGQKMLAELADTIIPTTDFIGAAGVKAHEFLLLMVDDCYPPDKQTQFINGLHQFDTMGMTSYGKSFTDCSSQQKNEWLAVIENKKAVPADVSFFYQVSKQHILQAFTSSKQYMLTVRHYNMVPGPNYKGCVPVNKTAG